MLRELFSQHFDQTVKGGRGVPENNLEFSGIIVEALAPYWAYVRATELTPEPNIFALSYSLSIRLALTELRGVMSNDIRMPFPGLFLQLPVGILQLRDKTGWHNVRIVTLAQSECGEVTTVYARLTGGPGDASGSKYDDAFDWVGIHLRHGSSLEEMGDWVAEQREQQATPPPPEVAMDIELMKRNFPRDKDTALEVRWLGSPIDPEQYRCNAKRFLVNVLLYLSSPQCETHNLGSSRAKLEVELARAYRERTRVAIRNRMMFGARTWSVGKNEPLIETTELRRLTYKTAVRGHWRNQACGPKLSQRRLLWIRPHTRGPGDQAVAHDYSASLE
jgi:hypothetical protein